MKYFSSSSIYVNIPVYYLSYFIVSIKNSALFSVIQLQNHSIAHRIVFIL